MQCPSDVGDILLDIIYRGTLRARFAGWAGNAAWAAREADHIHNLPWLVRDFALDRLHHYLESQVPYYAKQSSEAGLEATEFEVHWETLRQFLRSSVNRTHGG